MKTYAIGDIHGQADALYHLMEHISPMSDDKLIFIGDYIDRGSQSKQVVDYLLELKTRHECVFLRGNHEDMMLASLDYSYHAAYDYQDWNWYRNGGIKTMESYGYALGDHKAWDKFPKEHRNFFLNLLYWYQLPDWYFVHAGLLSKLPEQTSAFTMLWHRYDEDPGIYQLDKNLVYGHTVSRDGITKTPLDNNKTIYCIDTGAGYGLKLSALCIDTLEEFEINI